MNKILVKIDEKMRKPFMVHKIGAGVGAVVGFLAAVYVNAKTEPLGDL